MSWLKTKIKMGILHLIHRYFEYERNKLPLLGKLSPALWDMTVDSKGNLMIQGCKAADLAEQYGTPLYVVDRARLKKNYTTFYDSFHKNYPNIEIGYSYKTNPLPGGLKELHRLGASAEVISPFEVWLALRLGVPPERIIYNGPAKTYEDLSFAISHKIKLINIDRLEEIELIDQIAKKHNHRQKVGVRVITSVGWSSQFGLPIGDGTAFQAFQQMKDLSHVNPCGLHIHLGTGIKDIGIYRQAVKEVLDFFFQLKEGLGIDILYFDFGGGWGVPTIKRYTDLDIKLLLNKFPARTLDISSCPPIEDYSKSVTDLVSDYFLQDQSRQPTIIFEPGRAITSSAQCLLLKVIAIKPGKDGFFNVIVDGGKNITIPLEYEYHELFVVSKMNQPLTEYYYNIFGPLCHPSDFLYRAIKLPELEPGDILAVMDTGAYFIPNQMNFSYPRPAVVMVEKGQSKLLRKRETYNHIIDLDLYD